MPVCTICNTDYPNDCIRTTDDGKVVCCYCKEAKSSTIWTVTSKHSPPKIDPASYKDYQTPEQERERELLKQLGQTKTKRPMDGLTKQTDLEDFFGT